MIVYRILAYILLLTLTACFTGIESTPRITGSDVRKEHIETTPEQTFLADIVPQRPTQWSTGKLFHVTDNKVKRILSGVTAVDSLNLAGTDLVFKSIVSSMSVNGEEMAQINFTTADGAPIFYKTVIPYTSIASRDYLEIPFVIERSVVDSVNARMAGNRYYITTPLWYDASGTKSVQGRRHIPVDIIGVLPGDGVYPLRVLFTADGGATQNSVYMTLGDRRSSTRNFDTLLSFTDPRVKYPGISEDVWQLIINSKVKSGMTKTECRLALGQPTVSGQRPTTAGMVEYWSYSDGVYLLFEDGILTTFRR